MRETKIKVLEIVGCAAADYGNFSVSSNCCARLICKMDKVTYGELLPWITDIDKIMGNVLTYLWFRFCRSDIKIAVYLLRIGIYYGIAVTKEPVKQRCFSYACRAEEEY